MLITCTVSPTLKSDALWSDFTVLRFSSFILPRSLIFARSFCLSASIALASAFDGLVVHLLYFLIAASASAFASSMISDASWRAFARISDFLSESSESFICARSWSCFASSLSLAMSALSCSISLLLLSRSAIRVSKSTVSLSILALALSMMLSSIPSFFAMAKAFDFPGIPIISLYVGWSVATSNSQLAFSTPGVLMANVLSSL